MSSRVVVLGAGGFLGGALVGALRSAGHEVLGVGRRAGTHVDVVGELVALGERLTPADVVVCAAGLAIKDASSEIELLRGNLGIARQAADAAASRGARLLLLSSADIWPLRERAGARESGEVLPDTAYGFSKLVAESALRERAARGLRFAIARPSYVYGPGMFAGRLFPGVMRQAASGRVVLAGDPEARTDYLYVDDFTDAILLMLQQARFDGEIIHVASGALTRLADAARSMIEVLGTKAELVIDGGPAPHQPGPVAVELLGAMGFVPRFDVAAGCRAWVARNGGPS